MRKGLKIIICCTFLLSSFQLLAEENNSEEELSNNLLRAITPCVYSLMALDQICDDKEECLTYSDLEKCISSVNKVLPGIPRDNIIYKIGYFTGRPDAIDELYVKDHPNDPDAYALAGKDFPTQQIKTYSAVQIVNAFKANELKANNDFKGKEIIVKGYVDRISVNFGKVCVEIRGDELGIQNVGAYIIKSEENKAANLSAGQEIQVKGTCNGLSFLNVSLIDAVIL